MILITDGAYSSSVDQGGIGVVVLKEGKKIAEISHMYPHVTNNKMELGAVIVALRCVRYPVNSLAIYTDSMYVIKCALKVWQRRKNLSLWNTFDQEYLRVQQLCPDIKFVHIKGHSGDYWNEYVDNLARQASRQVVLDNQLLG